MCKWQGKYANEKASSLKEKKGCLISGQEEKTFLASTCLMYWKASQHVKIILKWHCLSCHGYSLILTV